MSMEGRRKSSVSSPHVSKKLCFTIVLFVGVICLSGGYVLGNVARNEVRKRNDIISFNLSTASELLYKKARRLTPKTVHLQNADLITVKLQEIFQSDCTDCRMRGNNIHEYVKSLVNYEAGKVIKAINNASHFIDTLR